MTQSQDITTPEQSLPPLRVIYSWATEYHAGWELCLYGAGSVSFRNEFTSAIWAVPEGLIHWATARIAPAPDQSAEVAAALKQVLISLKTYWRPDSQPCCGELIIKKMITTAGQSALAAEFERRECEAGARGRAEACAELRAELVQIKYGEERNVKKLSRQVAALTKEINTRDRILAAAKEMREKK